MTTVELLGAGCFATYSAGRGPSSARQIPGAFLVLGAGCRGQARPMGLLRYGRSGTGVCVGAQEGATLTTVINDGYGEMGER